jgi:hypothetical protein
VAAHEPDPFSADIGHFFGPITEAAAVSVRDVLICTTGGPDVPLDEAMEHPPVGTSLSYPKDDAPPVALGRSVRLDRLADDEAELVMNACTRRGHFFSPFRQFGQRYSFVRDVELDDWRSQPYRWDHDGSLYDAVMLSRLVRDNAFSTMYAARIIDFADGRRTVSYRLPWEGDHVYRVRPDRDWLDQNEASDLADLLATYWNVDSFSPRVSRAMWRCEYATFIRWGDVALPTIVGGLESLVRTRRTQMTLQFKRRVSALAAELAVASVDEQFCGEIYGARSDWVHGSRVELFAGSPTEGEGGPHGDEQRQAFTDLARMQDVLRAAIRRCIEDPKFRVTFDTDEAIEARWPV